MLTIIITVILALVALVALYILYMDSRNGELHKLGFVGPKCKMLMGTSWTPINECATSQYREFKQHKVFATGALRSPTITVTCLDITKDILVKHFNHFPERRQYEFSKCKSILNQSLFGLTGERWKKVRRIVSPTFSTAKLKRMSQLIEKKSKDLVENLKEKQESGMEVELKELSTAFTMDVIANSIFSIDVNSTKEPDNEFVKNGKLLLDKYFKGMMVGLFFPFILPLINAFGICLTGTEVNKFFADFIHRVVEERKTSDDGDKRHDYLQIVLDQDKENHVVGEQTDDIDKPLQTPNEKNHTLSQSEIEGAAAVFFLAGSDTVATALSFTLFLLAHHPEVMAKVQAEINQHLADEFPGLDNVQNLTYLDMCINETLRLYPPGFVLERHCEETVNIHGITFPKGYTVQVPVYAIHHDPDIWPMPEKFDPERFTAQNKASRHSCAFLPFGMGPRMCIGMRLALLELKMAVAAVLQHVTPVPCDKSVYPITFEPMRMVASNGLWVKFEQRTKASA